MNLTGKPTNPGQLRTLVTLESQTLTQGSGGFKTATGFQTIAQVYVKWVNVHGREIFQQDSIITAQRATVWLRWRADINESTIIKKGADRFNILSLDNVRERSEYVELKVELLKESG